MAAYPEGIASWNPAFRPHSNVAASPSAEEEQLSAIHDESAVPDIAGNQSEAGPGPAVKEAEEPVTAPPLDAQEVATQPNLTEIDGHEVAKDADVVGEQALNEEPVKASAAYTNVTEEQEAQEAFESVTKDIALPAVDTSPSSHTAPLEPVEDALQEPIAEDSANAWGEETSDTWDNVLSSQPQAEATTDTVPEAVLMHTANTEDAEVPAEAHYEYQSDLTQADLAVDESPTTGLLEEPVDRVEVPTISSTSAMTDEWGQTEDLIPVANEVDLSREVIDEPPADAADPWGATEELLTEPVDAQINVEQVSDPFQGATDDWGATEDLMPETKSIHDEHEAVQNAETWGVEHDDDFDAILGSKGPEHDAHADEAPRSDLVTKDADTAAAAPTADNDIEDLWAAAMDDDDLLDDGNALDPTAFFGDDDGGFLDDLGPATDADIAPKADPVAPSNPYQPPSSQLHHSVDPRPASTPSTFLPEIGGPFINPSAPRADSTTQPTLRPSSSFVGKSKSGYASPYDLPTEIVVNRRRPAAPVAAAPIPGAAPPPRSSSYAVQDSAMPPPGPARSATVGPGTSPLDASAPVGQSKPPAVPKSGSKDASAFFADLPVAPKTRAARPSYAPTSSTQSLPPAMPPQGRASPAPAAIMPPSQTYGGLQQPAKLPLYPDQPAISVPAPQNAQPPATVSRYSPAPAAQVPVTNRFSPAPPPAAPPAPAQSRYAAAPNASMTAAQRAHSFIPKTSSPLSYHEETEMAPSRFGQVPPGPQELAQSFRSTSERAMTPPMPPFRQGSLSSSPRSVSKYAPGLTPSVSDVPPRLSSGSPVYTKRNPAAYQASPGPKAGILSQQQSSATTQQTSSPLALPSRRSLSADLNFDVPRDERAADPLQRWKGAPILRWSPSGTIVSSFPSQAPFYAAGHAIPVIKCTSGPITIHDTKSTYPLSEVDDAFPGPLHGKGKGKKKEVLTWLGSKVTALETSMGAALVDNSLSPKLKTRVEEKLALWKVLKLLVEHDNSIDAKTDAIESARKILLPEDIDSQSPISEQATLERPGSGPDRVDARVLTEVRKLLLEGQRERAIWYATENKLWSHAMLIASTLGQDIWKQVIHEFVKSQVQTTSDSTRSLAAIYEVFGGNFDESIDELVPPFARAGFSTTSLNKQTGTNGLGSTEGLEKWRETLALILSNRTTNDTEAIVALGRLLANYGRVEAAHICFVFAGNAARHAGPDDADTAFVLLGADHKDTATALGSDLDSILATEIYEYLQSLSPAAGHIQTIPHLQSYKLMHAVQLAEHGKRAQAQLYCDSVVGAIKASTRASPYYHVALASAVDDLSRCLSQAPQTGASAGLLSKLSSEKVTGSLFKRFNTFVSGEDDDAASTTSGGENADGPFGRVTGSSPAISRAPSTADLYGAMAAGAASNGTGAFGSPMMPSTPYMPGPGPSMPSSVDRAPAGRYAPQSSSRTPMNNAPGAAPRSSSSYTPASAGSRAPSKGYTPYTPMQGPEVTPASNGSYMPAARPDAIRTSSDVRPQPEVNSFAPAPPQAVLSPPASTAGSYKPQPSPLSFEYGSRPNTGRSPSVVHSMTSETRRSSQASAFGMQMSEHAVPRQGSPYAPHQPDYGTPHIPENEQSGGYEPPTASFEPPEASYEPSPTYEPHAPIYEPPEPSYGVPTASDDRPASTFDDEPAAYEPPQASFEPPQANFEAPQANFEPPQANFEPPQYGYAPPAASFDEPKTEENENPWAGGEQTSSYQPYEPSYEPYQPDYGNDDDEKEDDAPKPKKKSFMDLSDDEDMPPRNAVDDKAAKAAQKAEADRQADEAFRKAAEADAAKDKASKEAEAKKGWFGGWFGKKDPDAPVSHRAKLGEENSFYFDKELGKWVNKKGGQDEVKAAPTPPPPMRGPSRVASGANTPAPGGPPGPPSRPPTAGPPSMATPPMPSGAMPPMRPPASRTASGNVTNLDDLLGAPAAKKGATKAKKRGGRYVDVMAK